VSGTPRCRTKAPGKCRDRRRLRKPRSLAAASTQLSK
jgi:hypothetical protein